MARDELTSVKTSFLAIVYFLCAFFALACCSEVFAQSTRAKAKNIPIENMSQVIAVQVQVKKKKKTVTLSGHCYRNTVGDVKVIKKKGGQITVLSPWMKKAKNLGKKAKKQSRNGLSVKKVKKAKGKAALWRKAAKLGNAQCKVLNNPNNPTGQFTRYTGTFGINEARTLFNRFGFGAGDYELNRAVREGMDATIARLTSPAEPANLNAITKDLRCEGVINAWDPDEAESCAPYEINSVDFEGVRYDIMYRALTSPFWTQIFLLYHELGTASIDVLDSDERHAAASYVDLLRYHSKRGTYVEFLRDLYTDPLMLKYLDARTSTRIVPNENYARELMELFSLGVKNHATGGENYNDLDVLKISKVLTGWSSQRIELYEDYYIRVPVFIPQLKDYSAQTIFQGTPYARTVRNNEEVVAAIVARPQFSEHLGYRILTKFVKPNPTLGEIRAMASIIRKHGNNTTAAIKELMTFKVLYANQRSLLKTPFEYVMGAVRALELRPHFYVIDQELRNMGQVVPEPPSVFAWDYEGLAKEAYTLSRMNGVMRILSDYTYQQANNNDWDRFLNASMTSRQVIAKMAKTLGVPLNAAQVNNYDQYMNYNMRSDGTLDRELFDADPDSDHIWRDKTASLAVMLLWTQHAQVK